MVQLGNMVQPESDYVSEDVKLVIFDLDGTVIVSRVHTQRRRCLCGDARDRPLQPNCLLTYVLCILKTSFFTMTRIQRALCARSAAGCCRRMVPP